MALFRRRTASSRARAQREAIAGFWSWWQQDGAGEASAAIADGEPERVTESLGRRIRAIDAALGWELGPGRLCEHLLVVTAEGDPALRAVARRWRHAAPADVSDDGRWEFSDVRVPAVDPSGVTLTLADTALALDTATAWARVRGARLDVTVYHPQFAALPQAQRTLATFLLLDTMLGEVAVETWVGTVEATVEPPWDAVPLIGLRAVIRDLSTQFVDDEGKPAWQVLQGRAADGARVLAAAQIPLAAVSAAHLDTHVAVSVPFADRTEDGQPGAAALQPLSDLEAHLNGVLGGSGRIVAHETRGGVRLLHAYVDGTTPAVEQLRAAITGWRQGTVTIAVHGDPGWSRVQHLRG